MRILIDYFSLVYSLGGVKKYIVNILEQLSKIDDENEYVLLDFKNQGQDIFSLKKPNFRLVNTNLFSANIYKKISFFLNYPPLNLFIDQEPDVSFFTNYSVYPVKSNKKILTIYDLSFIYFPQHIASRNLYFLKKTVKRSIKKANKIITISNAIKKEIIKEFNVNDRDIEIISPAVDLDFFKPCKEDSILKVKEKFKIKGSYFLFTSTLEPRKNITGILKAYTALPKQIKKDYSLVLAGGKGWQDKELLEGIKKSKEEGNNIIQIGYVPEKDLPVLYSGASIFLYPSFYEGFGIPILEAMACGVPVVTSNISSMPEVAGDSAVLVNPHNADEIKDAIIRLIQDRSLREELVRKGFLQAKKFSWEVSASRLLRVFKEVYKEGK